MDNKEKLVTEFGFFTVLGNQSLGESYNGSSGAGAGANASSRTDMIFLTSTPLSELVWSPRRGVSQKCADCSLTDRRLSFLCGIESDSMVLSPPPIITDKKVDDDVVSAANLNLSQMEPQVLACKFSGVNHLPSSPESIAGAAQVCGTMIQLGQGSCGNPELNGKMDLLVSNINEDDHSDKKEGNHLQDNSRTTDTSRFLEKSSMPGQNNGRNTDSSLLKIDKAEFNLKQKDPGYGDLDKATTSGPVVEVRDIVSVDTCAEGMQWVIVAKGSTIEQTLLPDTQNLMLISQGNKKEEVATAMEEDSKENLNMIPPLTKQESTSENELHPKGGNAFSEVGFPETKPDDEGKQSSYQNDILLPSSVRCSNEASPDTSRVPPPRTKDKGKALFNDDVREKIPKDRDGSHESVESCNSTGLLSEGKRKWSFGEKAIGESKKVKHNDHESSHFGPLIKQDSSFMNWISNMVKGLSKSSSDEAPSRDLTMRTSHQGTRGQETNMGFQAVFKALYCTSTKEHNKVLALDYNREQSPTVHDKSSAPIVDAEKSNSREIILSTDKFNQRISYDGEGTSTAQNVTSKAEENPKDEMAMPCSFNKVGVISSLSSFRNESDSPSEGKEASKLGSIDPRESLTSKSDSLGSLWITRFSPKIAAPIMGAPIANQYASIPPENRVASVRDQDVNVDGCRPSSEYHVDGARQKMQNYMFKYSGSFCSTRKGHSDQKKFNSKLNPIPTQNVRRSRNSEALATLFARRLDALRQIIPSDVAGTTHHEPTTCFFCGIKGHTLQDCSEITGSEIEDILEKTNSHNGKEESSCLCIRCFQLNHWAISCPNSWRKENSHSNGTALANLKSIDTMRQITGNVLVNCNDLGNLSENKDVHGQDNVGENSNKIMKGVMIMNGRNSDLKPAEEELGNVSAETAARIISKQEFILNGKQTVSSSKENESKENHITDLCNFVNTIVPTVPRATFEVVKRLRMSRTDILRWMKSPFTVSRLDGFFLRLRLRKWERGQEGTGYFVARITGAPGENRFPLSVNIAGFKCSIESRFISNNDFIEDELMAWWCATLSGGNKIPSEEELKLKLDEKKNLGF